jgi:hypothetical protein
MVVTTLELLFPFFVRRFLALVLKPPRHHLRYCLSIFTGSFWDILQSLFGVFQKDDSLLSIDPF